MVLCKLTCVAAAAAGVVGRLAAPTLSLRRWCYSGSEKRDKRMQTRPTPLFMNAPGFRVPQPVLNLSTHFEILNKTSDI